MRPLRGLAVLAMLALPFTPVEPVDQRAHSAAGFSALASLERRERELSGRVEERVSAGSYTYFALRTVDEQLRWVVTMGGGPREGAHVAVRSFGVSPRFYSKRLRREFPNLVFGMVDPHD